MPLNLDKAIEQLKQCEPLSHNELKELCQMVSYVLMEEANIQPIKAPVTVCGDIHGQFYGIVYTKTIQNNSNNNILYNV